MYGIHSWNKKCFWEKIKKHIHQTVMNCLKNALIKLLNCQNFKFIYDHFDNIVSKNSEDDNHTQLNKNSNAKRLVVENRCHFENL